MAEETKIYAGMLRRETQEEKSSSMIFYPKLNFMLRTYSGVYTESFLKIKDLKFKIGESVINIDSVGNHFEKKKHKLKLEDYLIFNLREARLKANGYRNVP